MITLSDDARAVQHFIDSARREINYTVTDFPVESLVDKYEPHDKQHPAEIFVPDYQRGLVWKREQISYFVESLILRVPIPPLFLYDKEGFLEIVDGSQRVRAIAEFMRNRCRLVGLDKLNFLNDFRFVDLPQATSLRFKNTPIRTFVLSESADQTTRADLFRRLNTSGTPLSGAEIRVGAYPGPMMDLIIQCANDPWFKSVCPATRGQRDADSERQELTLRFFAYYERYEKFDHDVARFLDEYLDEGNRDFSTAHIARLRDKFQETVSFVVQHFEYGFQRSPTSKQTPRVRFEALSVGIARALDETSDLRTSNIEQWLESNEFKRIVTAGATNSATRLRERIEFVRDKLLHG